MKVTRSGIEHMMQEELEAIQANAPRTEITRADIQQMMEEEAVQLEARGYGNETEVDVDAEQADFEGRYRRGKSESDDPRAQAFEQAISLLDDLQYDSLEDDVASYADDAVRSMTKAVQELDYLRNKVGNDPAADAARGSRPMQEARKMALKRDREKFASNQDMVSGLQKTITNYLKEAGVKIKPRHRIAVERISTKLMHVANSPMIRLEEGNIHYDGLMENIEDILKDELGRWHPEAKDSLKREVESQGFDLSQQILALVAAPL